MLIINVLMFTIVALLVLSAFLLYSFFKARRKERQKRPAMVLFTGKAPPIPKAEPIQILPPAESAVPTAHGSVEIRAPRPIPPKTRPVRLQAQAADAHIFPPSGDGSPPSEDGNDTSLDFSINVAEPEESGAVDRLPDSLFGIVFNEEEGNSLSFGQNTAEQPTEVPPVELAKNTGPVPSGAMIFKKRHELASDKILLVETGKYMFSFADKDFAETHPQLYEILKASGKTSICHLSEKPPQYLPIKKGDITRTSGSYVARVVPKAGDTFTDMTAPTADQLRAMGVGLARSPRNPESRNS